MMRRTALIILALQLPLLITLPLLAADNNASWRSELLQWRAKRAQSLTAPEGWTTLIGLDWLQSGDNRLGSAKDNSIVVSALFPAHAGVLRLENHQVKLFAPKEGFPKNLLVDGHAPQNGQTLSPDDASTPSKIKFGTVTILIIHRADKFGVRIKDAQASTRVNFHGLKWYAPNPAYRVHAKWIPYNPPHPKAIPTIIGTTENMPAPGVAEFTIDGRTYRLEPVIEEPGDKQLFFIMRDLTSKTETYGAGRFLYSDFPDHGLNQPGELVIDFNRAYNPPCAFTPYATCPLPPPENRLRVAIPAGEKRYHD